MEQTKDLGNRILYIVTKEISLLDIPRVLEELGYEVYQADFGIGAQEYNELASQKIIAAIEEFHIQYAISYDFVQTISQACMEAGVPYIAWVYDAPQKETYTHYAFYPCNYIFAFDKMQVQRLKEIGIEHVVYMPLAVHVDKVKLITETISRKRESGYWHDISFIGRLYKFENEDKVLGAIDEHIKQQLCENIDSCFMKWDKNTHLHGIMNEECVECFDNLENHKVRENFPYMTEQFFYEAAILSRMIAYRERVHVLNTLAEKYDVTLYTDDKDISELSEKVKIKPGMEYDVLTHVYQRSKINLNISLHCIETGVPQRVQDIMASGAFVLSNYQEELEELFVPGEEIVFYHNEQELNELVEYYLTHDEERERIARKGKEKVLRDFDYRDKITEVFAYVNGIEQNRKESYISLQSKELREKINLLLEQKTEAAYQKIFMLLADKRYETTIHNTTDLGAMHTLAEIWYNENTIGISGIFDDVDNVQQAESRYLKLKHGLWRIEQGLCHESCMDAIAGMRERGISKLAIAQMICKELWEKEDTMIKVAELMAEASLLEAVEMITYGLLFMEGNPKLLIQKADYLMKLNLWKEALATLLIIDNPTEDIKKLITRLSEVLQSIGE